jgi:Recombination, repair and ssDNA binding protein UvsY
MLDEIKEELAKLKEKFEEDVSIDQLNVLEKQYELPRIKHRWLIRHSSMKYKIRDLVELKEKTIEQATNNDKIKQQFKLDPKRVRKLLESDPQIALLTTKIEEYKIVLEYLAGMLEIVSKMSFDIKNIVDLRKIEEVL